MVDQPAPLVSIAKNYRTRACRSSPDPEARSASSAPPEFRLPHGLQFSTYSYVGGSARRSPARWPTGAHVRIPVHVSRSQQDRSCRAQAGHRARPRADAGRDRRRHRIERNGVDSIKRSAQAPSPLESLSATRGVRVRPVHRRRRADSPYELSAEILPLRRCARPRNLSPSGAARLRYVPGRSTRHARSSAATFTSRASGSARSRTVAQKLQSLSESQKLRDVA